MISLKFFTVEEAAERVERQPRTIQRWIENGDLLTSGVGGEQLIREDHLLWAYRDLVQRRPSLGRKR